MNVTILNFNTGEVLCFTNVTKEHVDDIVEQYPSDQISYMVTDKLKLNIKDLS